MLEEKERLVQAMKETLDHIAHDLRTPLMRLQSSAQHALQSATTVEACKESLADCQENTDVILRMLNAILDISEAEAGTLHLTPEVLSADTVIDDVISLYDFVAEEKGIRLVKDSVSSASFAGDRARLVQALANLVDNAIKYAPNGSRVTLSAREADGQIELRVSDQGPGISAQELPKVWTRLYRADQSRSVRGMGLGLNVVKAIAVAHGGNASATANPEGGCSFQVAIPLRQSSITKM
jgi:signal transduction histidine kinase